MIHEITRTNAKRGNVQIRRVPGLIDPPPGRVRPPLPLVNDGDAGMLLISEQNSICTERVDLAGPVERLVPGQN
jgi:hypothetical protein